jgi:hypothetical protein
MDLANGSGVRATHPFEQHIHLAHPFGKSICLMDLANRSGATSIWQIDLANQSGVRATHQQVANQICNSNWFVDSFHLAINQRDGFTQD